MFNATNFGNGGPFKPNQFRVSVGMHPEVALFKTEEVNCEDSYDFQEVSLPVNCFGDWIRLDLIGKPSHQLSDNQYYVALNFVGVEGATQE